MKSPDKLVQTHLTEEARASVQALADLESGGSVSKWVRALIMRELWARRASLKKRNQHVAIPEPMEEARRLRIDFSEALAQQVHDSMVMLAKLEGASRGEWLKGVILREIYRQRRKLGAARRANGE